MVLGARDHPLFLSDHKQVSHKNYNFLDCDWFKKLLFSTNSLAKLLSDSLLADSLLSYSLLADSSISQSRSKLWFKSTNHFQSCSLNQPISISEQHETIYFSFVSILMQIFPFFPNLAICLFSETVIFRINW